MELGQGEHIFTWTEQGAWQKPLELSETDASSTDEDGIYCVEQGESHGEKGPTGNSPLGCVFTNPLARKFTEKSLEEDFEHVLIIDVGIGWEDFSSQGVSRGGQTTQFPF